MGGKYPFFFRGGDAEYKEMQISGLISFNMDENNCFTVGDTYEAENRTSTPSQSAEINNSLTDLTSKNITREREFKLEVLNWLNDGKPKLFKSPTEGVYLVRLMNVSLSPNDTLGRMIHSFNATAYEMAKFSYENLLNYNMIGRNYEYYGNAPTFKIFNFSNEKFLLMKLLLLEL